MSEIFKQISDALADTVEGAASGIIRVEGRRRLPATGIAWREDVIITAQHVLRRDNINVVLPNGDRVAATLAGSDKNTDLAVLRVEASLTPLPQAEPGSLRPGHLVLAVGKPREQLRATLGVASAVDEGRMKGAIQTDVVMYPGFSGGPLLDASGHVQGMNTSGFNNSIAIATHTINSVVDTLLAHGRMRQGYLGVGAQPVRLAENLSEETGQETGLMVASVEAGSPAQAAGIYQGDIIVSLDNQPTPHLDALLMMLTGDRIGSSVLVQLVRGGQVTETQVTIGEKQ